MCVNDILSNNELGFVSICKDCDKLTVSLGTLYFGMNRHQFYSFSKKISSIHGECYSTLMLSGERIYINLNKENTFLSFNTDELNEAMRLFTDALLMLEIRELLVKF